MTKQRASYIRGDVHGFRLLLMKKIPTYKLLYYRLIINILFFPCLVESFLAYTIAIFIIRNYRNIKLTVI